MKNPIQARHIDNTRLKLQESLDFSDENRGILDALIRKINNLDSHIKHNQKRRVHEWIEIILRERKSHCYDWAFKRFQKSMGRLKGIQCETKKDLIHSFLEVLQEAKPAEYCSATLRDSEVQQVIECKRKMMKGHLVDFEKVGGLL